MHCEDLSLPGVKKLRVPTHMDERGFFRETFKKEAYASCGIACDFVQDNHSFSRKDVLRGMHFQRHPGQAKLVSVLHGAIFDVVVDIRKESPTYKKWVGVILDAQQGDQLFIPEGYAHGFCVISDAAHVVYKVNTPYDPQEEFAFRWDDPSVDIAWPVKLPMLSERDRMSPFLETT